MERKPLPMNGKTLQIGSKALFWNLLSATSYFASIFGMSMLWMVAARTLGIPKELVPAFLLAGLISGILCGLVLAVMLAPLQLRFVADCTACTSPEILSLVKDCFNRADLKEPRTFILDSGSAHWANAMVSGMKSGRGTLKPTLFITRGAVEKLSSKQLEAVLFHEASHLSLDHIQKRLIICCVSAFASAFISLFICVAAGAFLPEGMMTSAFFAAFLIATLGPFPWVKKQARKQELEADAYAVLQLGADPEAFISALRGLDEANFVESSKAKNHSLSGHPLTEMRIQQITQATNKRASTDTGQAA